jgi:predicted GIY-YIG superfamily endonuclease
MAKKPRNTRNYTLYDGNTKVYIGTTKDLDRRAAEHTRDGKQFTRMVTEGRAKTEGGARRREAEALETYRRGHRGRNPRYNQRDDG